MGASAGGLDAFKQLLKQLPDDTGFAFVLVQHLDPQHESALVQLLAPVTKMPVCEVTNNLRVAANRVYVIPPNTRLGIDDGMLKLLPRLEDGAALRSIDFFFEALAKVRRERAIGVILSGSATDGTLGLEAIKAEGGLTFAQDDSARFDSMPRSAIAAGCVDYVLSPGNIAKELARIARHPYVAQRATATRGRTAAKLAALTGSHGGSLEKLALDGYPKVLALLRDHSGVDFSFYRPTTIDRRIRRRMVLNRQETLAAYAASLEGNPKELAALCADALINVTSFFRNADAFEVLQRKVLAKLLESPGPDPVRIWVLGCSTGQEAYSIAMAFSECADRVPRARKLQIFATDINEANLEKARRGFYAKSLVPDVSPARLRRFFVEEQGGYRVIKALRELVVFARQNVIDDPSFSRMDLISCRNLMIYFEPVLQKKMLPTFHYALKPGGYLFLGASESIGGQSNLFVSLDRKQKIFARRPVPTAAVPLPIASGGGPRSAAGKVPAIAPAPGKKASGDPDPFRGELSAEREADRVMVNQFAPPGVLVNAELQILQFRGSTGAYLEAPAGRARFDLLHMAREGLMLPLRAAIRRAAKENQTIRKEKVPVEGDGEMRTVNLEVIPLKNLKERCFLVLFEDPNNPARPSRGAAAPSLATGGTRLSASARQREQARRVAGLERDLAETRDYLQAIQERQEAANEELQAANEEGQSANEELQSLNEELETSKEELESTNEELTTVNEEMVNRNAELGRLNSDLTNLQTATKLAIVLLGRDLTIRRFSVQAEKQFNLLASDLGRPIFGIRHNLRLLDLEEIVTKVVTGGAEHERELRDKEGRWFSLRVRPYYSADRQIDGAVLILVDIDELKRTERLIREAHGRAETVIRTVPNPMLILTAEMRVLAGNDAFRRVFKIAEPAVTDRSIFGLDHRAWNFPGLRRRLKSLSSGRGSFDGFEVDYRSKKIGLRRLSLSARLLPATAGWSKGILLGIDDITERTGAQEALRAARAKLALHADQLEKLVTKRTAQLTATNLRLEASSESNRRGKEEYRVLLTDSLLMQKKLRDLTHQIISAQEEERKEISRELHDEVVQTLIGINVELSALGQGAEMTNPRLKARIARTQTFVAASVNAVHRFARGLRPAVLDDLGLIPALTAFCKQLAEQKQIKIQITAFSGIETMSGAGKTALYRVAQEALTNVARHAQAALVKVGIREVDDRVRMEIADDGQSFAVEKVLGARNPKRLGLVGMKERVEMLGGSLTIDSVQGRGTTVRAEIPFVLERRRK